MVKGADEGGGAGAGMLVSLRKLVATLVAMVQTRLELISAEAEEEIVRLTRLWLLAAAALFLFTLCVVGASLFLVVLFWESHRLLVVGMLTLIYGAAGLAVALFARREALSKPRLFASSLAELAKDREQLGAGR